MHSSLINPQSGSQLFSLAKTFVLAAIIIQSIEEQQIEQCQGSCVVGQSSLDCRGTRWVVDLSCKLVAY